MKLNIQAPLNFLLGYGVVGLNITKGLAKNNDISLFPIGHPDTFQTLEEKTIIEQCLANQSNFDYRAPCLKIWHEHSLAERIGSGPYATISFFEINKFNTHRINNLNASDIIFCPSKWSKQVYENHNIQAELVLCPMGIDTDIFKPIPIKQGTSYKFLNVGKIEVRKGHDILCKCFNEAFNKNDDVELHIMWENVFMSPDEHEQWESFYKNTTLGDKIVFHKKRTSNSKFCHLINSIDCVILPTRAEGWCMPALQALACAKPLIITNYSAHTEFCNKKNSYLVEIDEMEPAYDGRWFDGTAEWAKLGDNQLLQIIEHMRYCYNNKISLNKEGFKTAKEFSWNKTINIIENTLGL